MQPAPTRTIFKVRRDQFVNFTCYVNVRMILDASASDVSVEGNVSIRFRIDSEGLRIGDVFHPIRDQVRMGFPPH